MSSMLLFQFLISHWRWQDGKFKFSESVEIAGGRWKCRFRWRRINEVQRIYCCCGTFYHTLAFLMHILWHLILRKLRFFTHILSHLEFSHAHSATPWVFSRSFSFSGPPISPLQKTLRPLPNIFLDPLASLSTPPGPFTNNPQYV